LKGKILVFLRRTQMRMMSEAAPQA
jgi:hypothetical protein